MASSAFWLYYYHNHNHNNHPNDHPLLVPPTHHPPSPTLSPAILSLAKLWKKLFCGLSKKFMYSEPVSPVPFPLICQFVEGPAGGPMWSRDHGQSVVSASEAIPQAQKPPQRGA